MEEGKKYTTIGRLSVLIPIICVIIISFIFAIMYISPTQSLFLVIIAVSAVISILLIASLILGAIAFANKKRDNYGLIGIIVSIFLLLCIIPMIVSSFVYLNVTPYENMFSYMIFEQNKQEKTLVVSQMYSDNLLWRDFIITGNCNTSQLGLYVKIGDTISNCSGNINIKYVPTKMLVGTWSFD
jgi:phosphate starvation-inducible membrane PsiE